VSDSIKVLKEKLGYIIKPGVMSFTTPFVWGPPGLGKSAMFKQIAKSLGIDIIDLRLSQLESSDLRGIPHVESFNTEKLVMTLVQIFQEGKSSKDIKEIIDDSFKSSHDYTDICRWVPPEFLPFKGVRKFNNSKGGILLLDEFNRARPDVLQAAFQLVLDREVGLNEIRNDWFIVAAGNLGMADGTDVVEMDTALKNRFIHFNAKVDLPCWLEWAEKAEVHPDVINFLDVRSKWLYPDQDELGKAEKTKDENTIITPRSWENFSNILKANSDVNIKDLTYSIGPNIIGVATGKFGEYLTSKEVVSPQDVVFEYHKKQNNSKTTIVEKKCKAMTREQIHSLNAELVPFVSKSFNSWKKEVQEKAIENIHDYANNHLDKDINIAFMQKLTVSCEEEMGSEGGQNTFIDLYLKKYLDDSRSLIKTLTGKKK
jgi:hypothetical protein